jgi:sulfite oxidase
VYRKSDL